MFLGVESSCDESALALFDENHGIIGDWVHSQIALHSEYGGIVPELASREHLKNFQPLLKLLQKKHDLSKITHIAVTNGPGLAACLGLGIAFSKSLAAFLNVPLCGVNHLRAHAFSPFIPMHKECPSRYNEIFETILPHIGLIVSGGNTLLFEINKKREINIIAQTVDDASGEALDKGAKLLGMQYPGGPLIEKAAKDGDNKRFVFPRAFPDRSQMKFSFSGLKTSLRYLLESMTMDEIASSMPDLCASYQQAVIDQLVNKTKHALQAGHYASIGLSGGVSNNQCLRRSFGELAGKFKLPIFIAKPEYTGDNAAMIAFAAWADEENTLKLPDFGLSFDPALTLS
jgi:N6-L-threonylcarbamoyladenine synthase